MDTSTLVSITGELPKEEVIESRLPPLLGPLLVNSDNRLSYKYSNILELENCKLTNHVTSKEVGTFILGHTYDVSDKYRNKYIIQDTLKYTSPPRPGDEVEKVAWIDMTHYQISRIINTGWELQFGTKLLTYNANKSYTISIPPGLGVFFCHSVVWKVLGLYEQIKDDVEAYVIQGPIEANKFRGIGGRITGITNRSSIDNMDVIGTPLTYSRLSKQYPKITDTIRNDSSTIRHTYFFGIIMFANTILHYTQRSSYSFPLELIPFSSKFIESFKEAVVEYSKKIVEIVDDSGNNNPSLTEVCKNSLVINVESSKYMMINIGEEYASKQVTINIAFSKGLQKFLGGKKSINIKDGVLINSTDHNEIIQRYVFKYPFYLVLLSTDERNDFQESMVDSKKRNIIAILHSEKEFTTTQSIIKLRPSSYNKLVLSVVNNKFEPLTETVFYNFIFRFRREFLEDLFPIDFTYWP